MCHSSGKCPHFDFTLSIYISIFKKFTFLKINKDSAVVVVGAWLGLGAISDSETLAWLGLEATPGSETPVVADTHGSSGSYDGRTVDSGEQSEATSAL